MDNAWANLDIGIVHGTIQRSKAILLGVIPRAQNRPKLSASRADFIWKSDGWISAYALSEAPASDGGGSSSGATSSVTDSERLKSGTRVLQ